MPAGSYDILIEQGATFIRDIVWKDSMGVPVDVTGYTARMQLRAQKSSTEILLSLTTENGCITMGSTDGKVHLEIPAETTATYSARRAVYDLEMIDPEGIVTRLLEGGVELSMEVTR